MDQSIRIQMMGNYLVFIDEQRIENPVSRSRKGSALLTFLILHRGYQVPNQRLLRELWSGGIVTNPENALKTLVSRTRSMLNQMADGLGSCLVSDRGAYHWEQREGIRVDVLELMDLFEALVKERDPKARRGLLQQVIQLYKGDLYQTGSLNEEAAYAERMHRQYLDVVYEYVDMLQEEEAYNDISAVCRTALEVDNFDDRLHIELMKAMVHLNRVSDAMAQYRHAANITYRYLGAEPSESMREFYAQLNRSRRSLKFNLDSIRNELRESSKEHGACVCDYHMFKEIYNLQMRNLERLGTTMFLGIIMIGDSDEANFDSIRQDNIMNGLIEILRDNLRKGDIITHFSPSVIALLLPTVNYNTGNMVMERIRQLFYKRYPNSNIPFRFRLGILGKDAFKVTSESGDDGEEDMEE